LGLDQAEHEESAPDAANLVISRLTCSLVGTTQIVTLLPGTLAQRVYGQATIREEFACNYGLNPNYEELYAHSELRIVGVGADGEVRMIELPAHPFYVATLFLPQVRSVAEQPHPLIVAYLQAARSPS
jgi:CTP synthase (UTP-ammonia lyase)